MYIDGCYDCAFVVGREGLVEVVGLILDDAEHEAVGDLHYIHVLVGDVEFDVVEVDLAGGELHEVQPHSHMVQSRDVCLIADP